MYMSEGYVQEFYERITSEVKVITRDYEIIFVDDGSPDASLYAAKELSKTDAHVLVVELSRNFGHHKGMMTGLKYAKGDYVYLTDIDLEEEPENLSKFWDRLKSNGDLDVVYGKIESDDEPARKKLSRRLFYKIFNLLSDIPIPENILVSRLMRKPYVEALLKYQEKEIFIAGLWELVGFNQVSVTTKKVVKGSSTYTFGRKLKLAVDAITSFSSKPLMLIFFMGLIISSGSFLLAIGFIVKKLILGGTLSGWTSLITSLFFLSGLIILSLGVVGIYISKVFVEVKARPYSIVRRIHGGK